MQPVHDGQQLAVHGLSGGNMNCRRDHVIARLPAIHVVIGVYSGEPRNDLVRIHVRRGPATGLEDVYDELRVVRAFKNLFGSALDSCGFFGRQAPLLSVYASRGALDESQGANERTRKTHTADREV